MPKHTIFPVLNGFALIAALLYFSHRFDALEQRLQAITSSNQMAEAPAISTAMPIAGRTVANPTEPSTTEPGHTSANAPNPATIRAIAQEVLRQQSLTSAHTATSKPVTQPIDNERVQATLAHVQTIIAAGTLRRRDADQLLSELAELPPPQQEQMLSALTQAMNNGVLRAEPGAGF